MDINDVFSALETGPSEKYESETLEFKEYSNASELFNKGPDVAKEICAMANMRGGAIVVGIRDSGNIADNRWGDQFVGIEAVDCLEVEKRINGRLSPSLNLSVTNHGYKEKNYLIIECQENINGLVMTTGGVCYIRSGRDSMPMTPEQVAEKVRSAKGYDWSAELCTSLNFEDALDDAQVEQALNEYYELKKLGDHKISREHFLESIGVLQDGCLTKGGLLFLGSSDAIGSYIGKVEYRFSQSRGGGVLDVNEVWSGSLWLAISKIKSFLRRVILYKSFSYDDKEYTFPNIAHSLFDEALINALVHRDYSIDGMVTIEFNSSSVTLENPGAFHGGITPENIFTHPARHRNKALAQILMRFEMLDRAGFGTKRMNIESLRLGRSKPRFIQGNGVISAVIELDVLKKGVFVVASQYTDYEVTELVLINLVYDHGSMNVKDIVLELESVCVDPWQDLLSSLRRMPFLSLVGNKKGVYLVVDDSYREVLNARNGPRVYGSSDAYVSIYSHLMSCESDSTRRLADRATNGDIPKVQRLLKNSDFVEKVNIRDSYRWALVN